MGIVTASAACTERELVLPPASPEKALQTAQSSIGQSPARSFVILRDEDLLDGAEADGKPGDFRLDNGKAVFIIDAAGSSLGFADSGGNLVDAAPVGKPDSLKQLFGYLDDTFPRQPIYDRVEAAQRGAVALVRASGRDSGNAALAIVTEYALAPGQLALEISSTVTNTGAARIAAYEVGDAIQWGRAERFLPGSGFGHAAFQVRSVPAGWVAGIGEGVSYAYVGEEVGKPLVGKHGSAWSDLVVKTIDLEPGASATVKRWFVVGGAADTASLGETLASLRRERWARLTGRVVEEGSGVPIAGASVVVMEQAGAEVAIAESSALGYTARLPPGDYRVRTEGLGRRGAEGLEVTLHAGESTSLDLLMSKPGALRFTVREGAAPCAAKLTLLGSAPTRSPRLGPAFASPGVNVVLTVTGAGAVTLPPGHYRALASRGPEYSLDEHEVEIEPGGAATLAFELKRVVDTHGFACVDLHQHGQASPDSAVSFADRAASNLAEGLDALVATDHNAIADYEDALVRLGITHKLPLVLGDEATLDGLGHWNAYPLQHREGPRGGAPDVRGKTAHEIVAALRAADESSNKVVQVNHPRAGNIGYFNNVGFDPRSPSLPPGWEGGFDAIEVFSSKDTSRAEPVLRDWFSLLDRGAAYTAVGGSDSHLIYGQEVGYPRSCVGVDIDDPSLLTAAALVDGIKRRRDVLVTNGPFVRVAVGGRGMGQLAPAPRGHARLDLEIQAAPWVDVRRFEIFINGERRGKPIELPPTKGVVRFHGGIDLRVLRDAYVIVVVHGDASLEPVVSHLEGTPPTTPLAFTNPIFLDRDGDGKYTAPGARPIPR